MNSFHIVLGCVLGSVLVAAVDPALGAPARSTPAPASSRAAAPSVSPGGGASTGNAPLGLLGVQPTKQAATPPAKPAAPQPKQPTTSPAGGAGPARTAPPLAAAPPPPPPPTNSNWLLWLILYETLAANDRPATPAHAAGDTSVASAEPAPEKTFISEDPATLKKLQESKVAALPSGDEATSDLKMMASNGSRLYVLKSNGNIWMFDGCWRMIDDGTGSSKIWLQSGSLFVRKLDGREFRCLDPDAMQWQPTD